MKRYLGVSGVLGAGQVDDEDLPVIGLFQDDVLDSEAADKKETALDIVLHH